MGSVLRSCCGCVAGLLKIPPWTCTALWKGKKPPKFVKAASIGAAVLGKGFKDVTFPSKAVDAVQLHAVEDDGSRRCPGKRAIVFVHGFPELWLSWQTQLEHFAALGHPVLALSMRGYCMSAKPQDLQSYELFGRLTQDVRAAVAHAEGGSSVKPLLVAHDWGAGVCWATVGLGMTSGHEVAGYVSLANPPGEAFASNFNLKQAWASLYMAFFNMPRMPEALFLARNALFTGLLLNWTELQDAISADAMNVYRTAAMQPGSMTAQLNYYRAAIQLGTKPTRGNVLSPSNRLPIPVLIIRGKQDVALLGVLFRDLDRYLTNYRMIEIDKCSHWIQHDAPDAVNKYVEEFLQEL